MQQFLVQLENAQAWLNLEAHWPALNVNEDYSFLFEAEHLPLAWVAGGQTKTEEMAVTRSMQARRFWSWPDQLATVPMRQALLGPV
jgi:hypothetical protein